MTLSNYAEDKVADAIANNVSLAVAALYAKLHIGDPGEDCTANPAVETTRKAVSFAASSGGTALSDALTEWTNVAATETYTHVSLWDNVSAGNPWGSGALAVPQAMTAGNTFDLPSGNIALAIN